jgi:hypothetical protein
MGRVNRDQGQLLYSFCLAELSNLVFGTDNQFATLRELAIDALNDRPSRHRDLGQCQLRHASVPSVCVERLRHEQSSTICRKSRFDAPRMSSAKSRRSERIRALMR